MATNETQAETSTPGGRSVGRTASRWALAAFRAFLVAIGLLGFASAYLAGLLPNALLILMLVMVPATIVSRLWNAFRRRLELGFLRQPLSLASRPYLLQALNRGMFWAMTAITLELALVPIQFEPEEFRWIRLTTLGLTATLVILQLVPRRGVRVVGNVAYAIGWLFLLVELLRIVGPQSSPDAVAIDPPFRGEWYVFQGGRSALVNHHYPIQAQCHALDLVMLDGGREVKGDPERLESYAAFGQPLFAPADGQVVRAVNDRPDMPIGETDTDQLVGNHVVIEAGRGRYVLLAHLQKGTVAVSEGQHVRRGTLIARCGNSGNTSAPHLHLQVQSKPDFRAGDLRTFPMLFRHVTLIRRGHRSQGNLGGLRRNDRIIPLTP